MNSDINSAVEQLINYVNESAPQSQDPEPKPFVFSNERDNAGVFLEHKDYVKSTCKRCFGRGFQTYLVGDGYMNLAADGNMIRVARRARNLLACICVHRGYAKARRVFERFLMEERKNDSSATEKQLVTRALIRLGQTPEDLKPGDY